MEAGKKERSNVPQMDYSRRGLSGLDGDSDHGAAQKRLDSLE